MKIMREKAGNGQTLLLVAAPVGAAREVKLPELTHAEAIALCALALCAKNVTRALEALQAWSVAACDLV